jgi:hypothetical protein
MEEFCRDRELAQAHPSDLPPEPQQHYTRYGYGSQREISAAPGQVRQPGPVRS